MSPVSSKMDVPGTAHLVDLEGFFNVQHANSGEKDVVLLPQPSSDPNDPLNWSRQRKIAVSLALLAAVFMGNIMTNLLSVALVVIEEDTGISVATLNQGFSIQFLFYGWANFFWVPLGITYGRRPVLLISALGSIAVALWSAYVTTGQVWYVNHVLAGVFYAPLEILIEVCITDMWFVHQRGMWISYFSWTLFATVFAGSIPAGYVASNLSWQWIQYIAAIISGACWVVLFFLMEETMYYRPQTDATTSTAAAQVDERLAGVPMCDGYGEQTGHGADRIDEGDVSLKDMGSKEAKAATKLSGSENSRRLSLDRGETFEPMPYASRLRVWGARRPGQPNHFFRSVWLPFILLRFPVIVMGGILCGACLCWYVVIAATIAITLTAPPYNFGSNSIGLLYIAPFIGITVGCFVAAVGVNRLAVWLSRRRGGIFEPEYRLWMFVIPALLHVGSCILWGVGAQQGIHWVGLAIAFGTMIATLPIGTSIAINYVLDSYPEVAGDALLTLICIRNTMGFGLGYGVTSWLEAVGIQNLYISVAFIGLGIWLLVPLFIFFGKRIRKSSAGAYWKLVEQQGLKSH